MYRKPIGPTAHGVIDYAFATLNTLAPTLFGLTGPAKAISYSFAATQGDIECPDGHSAAGDAASPSIPSAKHLYRVPATKPTPANPLPAAADHVAPHAGPRPG